MTTTTPARTVAPAHEERRTRVRRLLTVIAAAAGALALWSIVDPVAGNTLTVHSGSSDQTVGPAAVGGVALLAGLAGWALLALLERWSGRARPLWTTLATIVLVLSLLGPVGSGVGTVTRWTLAGMHLLVGLVLILGLPRRR
jgi:hypothetical protein